MVAVPSPPALAAPSIRAQTVLWAACLAAFLAAANRIAFPVLCPTLQHEFSLSLQQIGTLQAAFLVGGLVGQIPAGVLADRVGGIRVLLAGLLVWSLAGAALAATPFAPHPLAFILVARATLGLAQSVLMPGISATAAQWFPAADRGQRIATIYTCFNLGTVAGLVGTPLIVAALGWPAAFAVFGFSGVTCAAAALAHIPNKPGISRAAAAAPLAPPSRPPSARVHLHVDAHSLAVMVLLCWTHSVIGLGFFVMQAWVPTFLHSLGIEHLPTLGLASAAPWMASAVVSVTAVRVAQCLQGRQGWPPLRVTRLMHVMSKAGGLALLPLVAAPASLSPALAVGCLTLAVGLTGCNYMGYHAYVQVVASRDAGLVLGITNTCGTLAGIGGTVAAAHMGMREVMGLAVGVNALSILTWLLLARGTPLTLTRDEHSTRQHRV